MAQQAAVRLNPYLPWLDHGGRLSPFKTSVFVLLFLPALYVGWQLATHNYARPYILANHDLGDWAIRLLFVALAVTPLRQSLGLPRLIQVRRMVGVAAFCYALAHFAFFTLDKSLQLAVVVREIVLRLSHDDDVTATVTREGRDDMLPQKAAAAGHEHALR